MNKRYPAIRRVSRSILNEVLRKDRRKNFATIEDGNTATKNLRRIAWQAVREAASESKRLGLTAIVVRDNQVISISPRKEEKVIATLEGRRRKYSKGQVYHVRKG